MGTVPAHVNSLFTMSSALAISARDTGMIEGPLGVGGQAWGGNLRWWQVGGLAGAAVDAEDERGLESTVLASGVCYRGFLDLRTG